MNTGIEDGKDSQVEERARLPALLSLLRNHTKHDDISCITELIRSMGRIEEQDEQGVKAGGSNIGTPASAAVWFSRSESYSIMVLFRHCYDWPVDTLLELAEMLHSCGAKVMPWFLGMSGVCANASILGWVLQRLRDQEGVRYSALDFCIGSISPLHTLIGYCQNYDPQCLELLLSMPYAEEWMCMRSSGFRFTPMAHAVFMSDVHALGVLDERSKSRPELRRVAGPLGCIPSLLMIMSSSTHLGSTSIALCRMIRRCLDEEVDDEEESMRLWAELLLTHTPRFHIFTMVTQSSMWGGFWSRFSNPSSFVRILLETKHHLITNQPAHSVGSVGFTSLLTTLVCCGMFGTDLPSISDMFEGSGYESVVTLALLGSSHKETELASINTRRLLMEPWSVEESVRLRILCRTASPIPWQSSAVLDPFPDLLRHGVHAGGLQDDPSLWQTLVEMIDLDMCKDRVRSLVWLSDADDAKVLRWVDERESFMMEYTVDTGNHMEAIAGIGELRALTEEILVYRSVLRPVVERKQACRFPARASTMIISFLVPVVGNG